MRAAFGSRPQGTSVPDSFPELRTSSPLIRLCVCERQAGHIVELRTTGSPVARSRSVCLSLAQTAVDVDFAEEKKKELRGEKKKLRSSRRLARPTEASLFVPWEGTSRNRLCGRHCSHAHVSLRTVSAVQPPRVLRLAIARERPRRGVSNGTRHRARTLTVSVIPSW